MESPTISYETETGSTATMNTLQQLLEENIGKYVICELLIGLRSMTVREGILADVGRDYFALSNPQNGNMTSCDLYSLKFLTVPTNSQSTPSHSAYQPYHPMCGQTCNASAGTNACWMRMD